jgi:MFS superfamily sulfate permease-like transporter
MGELTYLHWKLGITFLAFGILKLGSVIGFFPRHILVG